MLSPERFLVLSIDDVSRIAVCLIVCIRIRLNWRCTTCGVITLQCCDLIGWFFTLSKSGTYLFYLFCPIVYSNCCNNSNKQPNNYYLYYNAPMYDKFWREYVWFSFRLAPQLLTYLHRLIWYNILRFVPRFTMLHPNKWPFSFQCVTANA